VFPVRYELGFYIQEEGIVYIRSTLDMNITITKSTGHGGVYGENLEFTDEYLDIWRECTKAVRPFHTRPFDLSIHVADLPFSSRILKGVFYSTIT
jgi:hypothetical protein